MKPHKFYGIGLDEPSQFIVCWNLGNSCNWSCDYCPKYLNDASVYWTDNELIKTTLLKIKNFFKDQQIRVEFMGGEVTTKPDFIDLMKFCREQGFYNHIVTNASRTVAYWERLSPYLDSAILSFHPLNANKEQYESVVDTMIKHNARPMCSLAMVKDKFWEMVEYKKYLDQKYQNNVYVDYMLLYDKENKHNYNGYFYDYDREQLDFLVSNIGKHFTMQYEDGTIRDVSFAEVTEEKLNDFTGYSCGTKLSMMNIDYYGGASISVCRQRRPINISTENFEESLKPRVCQQNECRNPSDLRILKIKQ